LSSLFWRIFARYRDSSVEQVLVALMEGIEPADAEIYERNIECAW